MPAIIFKEIRENAVIAMLMLMAVGAVLFAVILRMQPTETPLVSDAVHLVTAFAFPLVGFILGLQQVLVDRRRGRWDFVIHRPMSRTRIFFAKVIGGIVVYMMICVIPLAAAIGWVVTPGRIAAPFDWHMILPRVADLGSGLVWYVAGLLAAGRDARWFGSRLMPADVALVASIAAFWIVIDLWQALAIFAGAIAILLPAAWGAFVFGGEYEPQPLVIRMFQGIGVGPGVVLALFAGLGILGEILNAAFGGMQHASYYSGMYEIDSSGRIVYSNIGPDGQTFLADLKGHRLSDAEEQKFWGDRGRSGYLWLQGYEKLNMELTGLQFEQTYCVQLGKNASTNWMYVTHRRTIEGFDLRTRKYIGGIGPDGFVAAPAMPQPFPEPLIKLDRSGGIVASRTTAYQLQFDGQITKLFVSTEADPILDAEPVVFKLVNTGSFDIDYILATRASVFVFENGRELFRVPLEHTYPPYRQLDVTRADEGQYFFHYTDGYQDFGDRRDSDWIVETDAHGNVLKRTELPLPTPEMTDQARWVDELEIVGIPPSIGWAKLMYAGWGERPHPVRGLVRLIGVGIVSAGLMLILLPAYDQRRGTKIVWIVIGIFMGFSGVLLLLSLRTRVARISCVSCSKPRLVSREMCEHCQAPFPEPTRQGIEIFESV